MKTRLHKTARNEGAVSILAREAYLHLISKEHGPSSLAQALRITPATLTRVLGAVKQRLAKDDMGLRLVGRGAGARYEILGYDSYLERAWRSFYRSLRKVWATPGSPGRFNREDAAVYGRG